LTKTTFADLVTETDKNVEDMIIAYLRNKFPTHRCVFYAVTVNNDTLECNNANNIRCHFIIH